MHSLAVGEISRLSFEKAGSILTVKYHAEISILRVFKFSGRIITTPPGYFSMENSLFKNIFGHNFCICQPIFKICVAHFTTNLVLYTVRKIFCLPLNKL